MVRLVELSFLLLSSHAFSEARQARRSTNASDCVGVKAIAPGCESKETLAQRDYFYIGGHYVNSVIGNLTYDQVYVEKITPVLVYQPKPVVFFHGGGMTLMIRRLYTTGDCELTSQRCLWSNLAEHA